MPTPVRRSASMLAEYVLGAIIGIGLMLVVLIRDLPETYQSVDLPATPLYLRLALTAVLWLAVAAALAYWRAEASWRWGLRLATPSIVVFGFVALASGGDEAMQGLLLVIGTVLTGSVGGWIGADQRRRRAAAPPPTH